MALPKVHIVGGGLAGTEAALQLARLGLRSILFEMRPDRMTPAHRSGHLAELVCSNSLKSTAPATAQGLLKDELDILGCRLLGLARQCAVPAGSALAVDRDLFGEMVTTAIQAEPLVELRREEISEIPEDSDTPWIIAAGPLCSETLQKSIAGLTGADGLHFFDAIAPTVTAESLDMDGLFRAARYDRGDADYLNSALDKETYLHFVDELNRADRIPVADFDRRSLFDGCKPVEEIAATGPQSLAFGPLRPVGLIDPRSGRRPHAVVQLRQEDRGAALYGLVGFQTRLRHGEQKRVFRMLPGLRNAEFVRLGQMHRNFYIDSPRQLGRNYELLNKSHIHVAGQITGVEGYVESIASGIATAWKVAARAKNLNLPDWPATTLFGTLLGRFLFDSTSPRFSPMNASFGLLPAPLEKVRGKRERKLARSRRALDDLNDWTSGPEVSTLLAGAPRA